VVTATLAIVGARAHGEFRQACRLEGAHRAQCASTAFASHSVCAAAKMRGRQRTVTVAFEMDRKLAPSLGYKVEAEHPVSGSKGAWGRVANEREC